MVRDDLSCPEVLAVPGAVPILDQTAYPSITDVPEDVDLAHVIVKNTLVPKILEDCAAKGVKVEIKPRHRSQTRIWLDPEVPGRDLAGIQKSILKTHPELSVKPAACPPLKTAQR